MQRLCRIFICWMGLLGLLGGCDKTTPVSTPATTKKVVILAVVYPLADVARRVGGDLFDVQWLVDAGQHPSDLRDTLELRRRAGGARIVLTSGPWDTWASSDLTDDSRAGRLLEPQRMPAAGGRDGSAIKNPAAYLWLDPRVAIDLAQSLREKFDVVEPSEAKRFQENLAPLRTELEALDAEIRTALEKRVSRKVLVVRPVWSALLNRYQLEQIAPVQGPEIQLSTEDYKALKAAAKANGLTTLYVDLSTPVSVRQQITERTGLKILTLDAIGTSAPSGNSTYGKMMRYNLGQLMKE